MMSRRRICVLAGALLMVGVGIAVYCFVRTPPGPRYKAPLVISVQAFYPGANAQTVADTMAGPIEQQVNGVEHMLSMSSLSSNEGSYALHITFEAGTDLDVAQVLVQNRVNLAIPVLPTSVQLTGISVRKKSPEPLMLISLTSPDQRYDVRYLSNYSTIHVKEELARLPGVSDIVVFGQRDDQMRVVLDADRLAAFQLSVMDVVTALGQQNLQVAAGQIGQAPTPKGQQHPLTINTLGRLTDLDQVESVIVKAIPDGRTVRLKDVARVELGGNESSMASLNGTPAVLLGIHTVPNVNPIEVSGAVLDKLAELRANLPDGLALAAAFDFAPNLAEPNNPTTPEHLVIDAELPASVSAERRAQTLERAADLLRKTPGVQDVLALSEHPFALDRNRSCLVVRLTGKDQRKIGREQFAGNLRRALSNQINEAVFRVSVPSTAAGLPLYGFPIELAIEDHGDHGSAFLQERVEALVEKLNQSGKFSDIGIGSALRSIPILVLDIDRPRCLELGVELNEIFNTVQVYLGSKYVSNLNQFGRTWQIAVQVDPRFRERSADLLKLQVKNKENESVRLGTVLAVRESIGLMGVERHNLCPIARISANLAEGTPLGEAKSLCETLAEQEFGTKQFKLIWRTIP